MGTCAAPSSSTTTRAFAAARGGCSRPPAGRSSARPATRPTPRTAAAELRPDLVLLDVQLPDGDGFDVAGDLTAGDDHPAVVLVSTRDAGELDELARRRGAQGFVAKDRLSARAIEDLLADGPNG